MTLPDPSPPRKHHRWFLYAPWLVFLAAILAWSGYWLTLRSQLIHRTDAAAEQARDAGWQVSWTGRRLSGFPFRLEMVLDGLEIADPSGWGLSTPQLRAETFAYRPDSWVGYTPSGLTLARPDKPPLQVRGKLLRASLTHLDKSPPSLSVEGADLTFSASAGPPPAFQRAARLQLYLRAGPDDQGAAMFRLDSAIPEPTRWLGRVAHGRPATVVFDGIFSHASALQGPTWARAVQRWAAAGGQVQVRQVQLAAADAALTATAGALSAGADGRLRGALQAELRQAPQALAALGDSGGVSPQAAQAAAAVAQARQGDQPAARVTLNFEAGQTTLGPVALAPAPRIF